MEPKHITESMEVYSDEDFAWLMAVERYQREHNRRYPDNKEILALAKSMGYRKVVEQQEAATNAFLLMVRENEATNCS